ncbi:alpha-amylase family glycosyl hydrolase [Halioxenophilus aromaticivorans]|uniref:Alpha-glucosidase family protein n=1 Tax=Halioxenophilus aromaticivorans TaxID=1306992 RepID=A0AAV3TXC6_9ALTE
MGKLTNPLIYEIYPRSFYDSSGTGEGDLNGIAEKLSYVKSLGVDAIWIAPFYPSSWHDGGYDVIDHCNVDPRLGTLADFDRLVGHAQDLGLSVLVDLVFKHTSVEHPWFKSAVEGDQSAAERYVWRDAAADGTPPTNWIGYFGKPAWSWCHQRQQYYLHQYHASQPALNHRNQDVQNSIREIMAFWCDRGVAGFRFDAVTSWFHDDQFRDNPPASDQEQRLIDGVPKSPYTRQRHEYDMLVREGANYMENIRAWAGRDLYLFGENNFGIASLDIALDYTGAEKLNGCYTTDTVRCGHSSKAWQNIFDKLDGRWRTPWWFESHDRARSRTNLGNDSEEFVKFLAVLTAILPGAALIYQGQELGLPQPPLDKSEIQDPFDLSYWPDDPGRSGARVPIPWTEAKDNFGFSSSPPWLPMRWQAGMSIESQETDKGSPLNCYRHAIYLRKKYDLSNPIVFNYQQHGQLLTVFSKTKAGSFSAVFNFGDSEKDFELSNSLIVTGVSGGMIAPYGAAIMEQV